MLPFVLPLTRASHGHRSSCERNEIRNIMPCKPNYTQTIWINNGFLFNKFNFLLRVIFIHSLNTVVRFVFIFSIKSKENEPKRPSIESSEMEITHKLYRLQYDDVRYLFKCIQPTRIIISSVNSLFQVVFSFFSHWSFLHRYDFLVITFCFRFCTKNTRWFIHRLKIRLNTFFFCFIFCWIALRMIFIQCDHSNGIFMAHFKIDCLY